MREVVVPGIMGDFVLNIPLKNVFTNNIEWEILF